MVSLKNILTILALAVAAPVLAQSGSATITSAAKTTAASASQVVFTFPGGVDGDTLIASLIGTANSMTTVYIGCPEGDTTCNFTPPATVVGNPTTLAMTQIFNTTFSYYYSCKMSAAGATCTESATGIMANFVTQTTGTASLTQSTSTIIYNTWNSTSLVVQTVPLITGDAVGQILGATSGSVMATASATASSLLTTSGESSLTLTGTVMDPGSTSSATSHSSSSAKSSASSADSSSPSSMSSNDVAILAPGMFAAVMLGLAAVLL